MWWFVVSLSLSHLLVSAQTNDTSGNSTVVVDGNNNTIGNNTIGNTTIVPNNTTGNNNTIANTTIVPNTTVEPDSCSSIKLPYKTVRDPWTMQNSVTEFYLTQFCDELTDSHRWTNAQTTVVMATILILKGVILLWAKQMGLDGAMEGTGCCTGEVSSNEDLNFCCGSLLAPFLDWCSGACFVSLIFYGTIGALRELHLQGTSKTSGGQDGLTWDMFWVMFTGLISYNPSFVAFVEFVLKACSEKLTTWQKVKVDNTSWMDRAVALGKEIFTKNPFVGLGLGCGLFFIGSYFFLLFITFFLCVISSAGLGLFFVACMGGAMILPIICASCLIVILLVCVYGCSLFMADTTEKAKKVVNSEKNAGVLEDTGEFVAISAVLVMLCLWTNVLSIFFTSYHPYGKGGSPIAVWMVCRDLLARLYMVILLPLDIPNLPLFSGDLEFIFVYCMVLSELAARGLEIVFSTAEVGKGAIQNT